MLNSVKFPRNGGGRPGSSPGSTTAAFGRENTERTKYTNLADTSKECWECCDSSIESCELKILPDGDKALD